MLSKAEEQALAALARQPEQPEREFVRRGERLADVYALAAAIRDRLDPENGAAPVCLATDNKAVLAAALLASLAGGQQVLLPYSFATRPLVDMQETTGFSLAISDAGHTMPSGVDTFFPGPDSKPVQPAPSFPHPGDRLLQIFTGGSTGSPQIWTKTVQNIFGEALFLSRHFAITEQDCIVSTISPCHIYGLLFSIALPLVSGASVVAATPSFPGEIRETIQRHGATILAAVPPHYRALSESPMNAPALRLAISSAGMLEARDNEAFCRLNRLGIEEVFGSTETGGIASRNRFRDEEHFTAFSTVRWRIKEDRLAISSPYISPDLPLDTEGFFLSADRVEKCPGNGFLLKGRADAVTKVGGKRVDLEEVRTLIAEQDGIQDCVVVALPDPGGRGQLIGVLIQGSTVKPGSIRQLLADRLEPYALPRIIKTVARMPMKDNGKYDRAAIRCLLLS